MEVNGDEDGAAGREWRLLDENGGYWTFEEKKREWEGWVPPHPSAAVKGSKEIVKWVDAGRSTRPSIYKA